LVYFLLAALVECGCVKLGALGTKIDQLVAAEMQQSHIPGLALAVLYKGEPVLMKGYGYADLQGLAVKTDTRFGIGSVSKSITAFAVMLLVQQGKLSLNDSVLKYLPRAPKQWQPVTIRQLLSHTSGIPQYQGPHLPWLRIWQKMANKPMQFPPGTHFKYNNFGYIVLGRVIEKVSQQSLSNFLAKNIFTPLNMMQTGFPDTFTPPGLAAGYRVINNKVVPNPNRTPWLQMWGSGGVLSSISDMAKWDAAMTKEKLLQPASYQEMWRPVFLQDGKPSGRKGWSWALGWQVSYFGNKLVAQKNGAIRGYSSWVVRHIDEQISIIILVNTNHVPLRRVANKIYTQFIWVQTVNS
uniref:serine hydrolase domain-containing protein n=1 Tax=Legionella tunisiensis TaxID=1034944 RepID=UPI0012EAC9E2